MADCQILEPLLQAHVDDELSPDERAEVEGHLDGCGACRGVLADLTVLAGRLAEMYATTEAAELDLEVPGVPRVASAPAATAAAAAAPDGEAALTAGYRIEREIARGGFGTVYRAVQRSMERPVALKVMAPHLAEDKEFVARFLREARVAATLTHPNLVAIYDVGEHDGRPYYSMELVDGEDVEAVLKRDGFVPQRKAAEVGLGVARALEAAAAAGVVHRDIKPANVLITAEGGVKLADLGLAKALESDDQDAALTMKKKVIGSPNYMSPEQGQDLRRADHRSDVYSLGATLLHMVGGRVPFGTGSPVEVLARVLREPVELPELLPSGERLDPALGGVILRCMAKAPEERYPDAAALAADLEAYLAGQAVEAGAPPSRRSTPAQGTRRPRTRRSSRTRKRSTPSSGSMRVLRGGAAVSGAGRRTGPSPLLVLAAAAAVAAVVGLALSSGGGPVEEAPEQAEGTPAPEVSPLVPDEPPGPRRVSDALGTPADAAARRREREERRAEEALADLRRWRDDHPEHLGEVHRRAEELAAAFPETAAAEAAREIQSDAEVRLEERFAALQAQAGELQTASRWDDARRLYRRYLEQQGERAPHAAAAKAQLQTLDALVTVQLSGDLDKLDGLLARGLRDDARSLVGSIEGYAGPGAAADARARLDAWLAAHPEPAGEGEAVAEGPPGDEPSQPDAIAAADERREARRREREAQGRELLAQARGHLERREFSALRELLPKLRRELEGIESLAAEVESLKAAYDAAMNPAPAELLAAYFQGEVEVIGEKRIRIHYGFDRDEEAADWIAAEAPTDDDNDRELLAYLEGLTSRRARDEPWAVHRSGLAGFGWSRRRFAAPFRSDAPLEVSVEAQGGQNMLLALGDARHTHLVGLGFLLEELPFADWGVSQSRLRGKQLAQYIYRRNQVIEASQRRGPSLVVFREQGPLQLEELVATPHNRKRSVSYTVTLTPRGEHHELSMVVGRATLDPVLVEEGDTVSVDLATLGASVLYQDITLTGTVTDAFLERLEQAAREVGVEPEALRRRVREAADERARDEERRREEERRRREEERRRRGGDDEGGDEGGD